MKTSYDQEAPQLKIEKKEVSEISHNHSKNPPEELFGKPKLHQMEIKEQKTSVKNCMAFFKVYAKDETQPTAVKAALASILADHKELLKKLESHETSSECTLY